MSCEDHNYIGNVAAPGKPARHFVVVHFSWNKSIDVVILEQMQLAFLGTKLMQLFFSERNC